MPGKVWLRWRLHRYSGTQVVGCRAHVEDLSCLENPAKNRPRPEKGPKRLKRRKGMMMMMMMMMIIIIIARRRKRRNTRRCKSP
jgi:hypothetical protein